MRACGIPNAYTSVGKSIDVNSIVGIVPKGRNWCYYKPCIMHRDTLCDPMDFIDLTRLCVVAKNSPSSNVQKDLAQKLTFIFFEIIVPL